jgi:hypothetical protein
LAKQVVTTTRRRTKGQRGIPFVSDGWEPYVTTITTAYAEREPSGIREGWDILRPVEGIRLTQAIKHRKGRRLVEVEVRATIGEQVTQPYAVHLERLNGTLRDRLSCLTRKTHAFAKDVATWDALFSLTLFEHNWIRAHRALRCALPTPVGGRQYEPRTPAKALGCADHAWSWEQFLRLSISPRIRSLSSPTPRFPNETTTFSP